MSSGIVMLYTTCANEQQAHELARTLLQRRLVACVNIHPAITSLYRWQGEIQQEKETQLFAKTTEIKAKAAVAAIKDLHSYEIPCVTVLPVIDAVQDYINWVKKETS